jgi:1-acyl-sn-glycerol-3-phosphate acyltransferase
MFLLGLSVLVAYFAITIVPVCLLLILISPFPYRMRAAVVRRWGESLLRLGRATCGLDWTVEGRENLPPGPSVIYIKHSSIFETYAQVGIFPPQTWVVKRELLWVPVLGWGMWAMRCIAIDRGAGRKAVNQVVTKGRARLAEGIWITIFPEGTRMPPGKTHCYGISGAVLAREAGCLIVPVAHNARDFFPRKGLPKRSGRIRICIGPPIDPSAQAPRATNELAQDWIEAKMAEISEGYRGSRSA